MGPFSFSFFFIYFKQLCNTLKKRRDWRPLRIFPDTVKNRLCGSKNEDLMQTDKPKTFFVFKISIVA